MSTSPFSWRLRRLFWAQWEAFRFDVSKPKHIKPPEDNPEIIGLKPFPEIYPELSLCNIPVFDRLPGRERSLAMKAVVHLGLFFNRIYPQMQADLPKIDADMKKAMDEGLIGLYRATYRPPGEPQVFKDAREANTVPDLGTLAIKGPYSLFLQREGEDEHTLVWDFTDLGKYEHQPGLALLGVKVLFSQPKKRGGRPEPQLIVSKEYGEVRPGDEKWDKAVLLAICAATTHLSLIRHFNYVHLITANHWDCLTRNLLPIDHPIYLLLWPHIFDSCYSNYAVIEVQMAQNGDFVHMFSFTHSGLMHYLRDQYEKYDYRVMIPREDWKRRGLAGSNLVSPSQHNLCELYDVMHDHALRYVNHYYPSDEALAADSSIRSWLASLDEVVPNGIDANRNSKRSLLENPTRQALAKLLGGYMYESNSIHELVGGGLWDYQLWADMNPVRIYQNGQRLPLDVYQRVINNNFALQVDRAWLCDDYQELGLDQAGHRLFARFAVEVRKLQVKYSLERWAITADDENSKKKKDSLMWRMEPRNLKVSMNG